MTAPRRRSLSLTQQAWALCSRDPTAQRPVGRAGCRTWTVELQPTPLSLAYTVRLEHREADPRPKVTVVDPVLTCREGESLPHVFAGDELCLYYDEFDARKHLIADTVVPWASEWLYYYELWLTTGDWRGGGVHPDDPPAERRTARRRVRRARRR